MIRWDRSAAANHQHSSVLLRLKGERSIPVGNNVLPSVIVKRSGVFGSHSLVPLEAAVGSVGCADRGGVSCVCVHVFVPY